MFLLKNRFLFHLRHVTESEKYKKIFITVDIIVVEGDKHPICIL